MNLFIYIYIILSICRKKVAKTIVLRTIRDTSDDINVNIGWHFSWPMHGKGLADAGGLIQQHWKGVNIRDKGTMKVGDAVSACLVGMECVASHQVNTFFFLISSEYIQVTSKLFDFDLIFFNSVFSRKKRTLSRLIFQMVASLRPTYSGRLFKFPELKLSLLQPLLYQQLKKKSRIHLSVRN